MGVVKDLKVLQGSGDEVVKQNPYFLSAFAIAALADPRPLLPSVPISALHTQGFLMLKELCVQELTGRCQYETKTGAHTSARDYTSRTQITVTASKFTDVQVQKNK